LQQFSLKSHKSYGSYINSQIKQKSSKFKILQVDLLVQNYLIFKYMLVTKWIMQSWCTDLAPLPHNWKAPRSIFYWKCIKEKNGKLVTSLYLWIFSNLDSCDFLHYFLLIKLVFKTECWYIIYREWCQTGTIRKR
jgi:hypothetical protein